MNKGKYYILPDGVEIKEINQKMFTGNNGFAYQDERLAEYSIAIGSLCECGEVIDGKSYTACTKCRERNSLERFNKLEEVIWDGETPLCTFEGDDYFYDEDDIEYYCEDNDIDRKDLQLVLCEPNKPRYFDLQDYCYDDLPEDYSIYDCNNKTTKYSAGEVEAIVNAFFEDISPISWSVGNKRVSLDE